MSVLVPVLLPVFHRPKAGEAFVFQHMSNASFLKQPPKTLRVSDLHQHSHDARRERGVVRAGLLVLATGDRAVLHTLDNWDEPKEPFPYQQVMFPATGVAPCAELEDGYSLVPVYSTLSHYAEAVAVDTAAIEAAGVVIPHLLCAADVPGLGASFRIAYHRAAQTATWVVDGEPYNEYTREPKRRRTQGPAAAS